MKKKIINLEPKYFSDNAKKILIKYFKYIVYSRSAGNIKNQIILSHEQLEAAKESLLISTKRLEAGITTQREIVNTQGDVIEAETNFIKSIKEYKKILATFYRITSLEPRTFCISNYPKNEEDLFFYNFLNNKNLVQKCNKV